MNTLKKLICAAMLILASYNSHAQASAKINITNFTANEKNNKLSINWSTMVPYELIILKCNVAMMVIHLKRSALFLPDHGKPVIATICNNNKTKTTKPVYFRLCHVNAGGEEQVTKMIEL